MNVGYTVSMAIVTQFGFQMAIHHLDAAKGSVEDFVDTFLNIKGLGSTTGKVVKEYH
jgi:hypothetical protein